VVTKIPRFTFEKFPSADAHLTTQMKSVGEVMAIGRNLQESLHKATRGLEIGVCGLDEILEPGLDKEQIESELELQLSQPGDKRLWYVAEAFRHGYSQEYVFNKTKIDPKQVKELRHGYNIRPVYKRVDTCAAEFQANTAYMYSSYDEECEALRAFDV